MAPKQQLIVVRGQGGVALAVPPILAGDRSAARLTLEFFAARIPNLYTRLAYVRAVWRFCGWCEGQGLGLHELVPTSVAAYYEHLRASLSVSSLKLHSAALRHWLDYLTERGALAGNPARSVRTPRLVVTEGKTPVLEREEARRLFAALDAQAQLGDLLAFRDRALFAVMLFGLVRVGAAVRMQLRDFEDEGPHAWLCLHEKGGKERRIPCHHQARAYLRAYVEVAGFAARSREPLFQSAPRRSSRTRQLSGRPLTGGAVWDAVKRRCHDAGLPATISNHSFRATGITLHQDSGGRLEDAQDLAGHADARTTRLYVRKPRAVAQREVERIQL